MWLKYDSKPILMGEQYTRRQHEKPCIYGKPSGFWITDDSKDNWHSWCLSENFRLDALTHVHKIDLDESRILFLRSAYEIDCFTRAYGVKNWWGGKDSKAFCYIAINWKLIAERHSGIIITPYIWSRRMEQSCEWYYAWDCASGCIWDANAILKIELMDILPIPEPTRYDYETEGT